MHSEGQALREGGTHVPLQFWYLGFCLFCGFVLVPFLHSGMYSIHVNSLVWGRLTLDLWARRALSAPFGSFPGLCLRFGGKETPLPSALAAQSIPHSEGQCWEMLAGLLAVLG